MAAHYAALTTFPCFEDIAALEVKELIGAKATAAAAGIVVFKVPDLAGLCRLCFLSQSANDVFLFRQKPVAAAVTTEVLGQSLRINPFGLGKREYEVFGNNGGVSGNLAYLLLRAAGYDGRQFIFDPFTRSGAVAIEAALFSSGFPVNHYRRDALSSAFSRLRQFKGFGFGKLFAAAEEAAALARKRLKGSRPKILSSSQSMQGVRFAEKNARIAGVNKLIRFSRLDIGWLDAKLDEHSVELVVSYPPQFRSSNDSFAAAENSKLKKLCRDFFYQADFFMKKNGSIVFLLKGRVNEGGSEATAFVASGVDKGGSEATATAFVASGVDKGGSAATAFVASGVDKGGSAATALIAAAADFRFKPVSLRKLNIGGEGFEIVSFTKL
ncbi:hypothetical protein HYU17_02825 [Candidatus Woesearchaeota archaeon]|nr:hypothetical protein [Candidatus Woesearchaeota archaeon]